MEYHTRFTWVHEGDSGEVLFRAKGQSPLGAVRNATGQLRRTHKRWVYDGVISISVEPCLNEASNA